MSSPKIAVCVIASLAVAAALGCEDEPEVAGRGLGGGSEGGGGKKPSQDEDKAEEQDEPTLSLQDEDFVESERNRDPFRSYVDQFEVKAPEAPQRRVVMPTTAVEEMRLIAIVTGMPRPRAMFVDPLGVGHTVERGAYIGRPQLVQTSENVSMTLNWRVDRIRANEVVLTREDPTDPARPPLTRVIPLHDKELALAN